MNTVRWARTSLHLRVRVYAPDVGYHIAVKTGNTPGGSSDSTVYVKLYGDKGDTGKMMLVPTSGLLFDLSLQINRLMIGHNNEGMRAGWFLDSVQILVPLNGKHYMFPCHRWLSKGEADGKTEVIYPFYCLAVNTYEVCVFTGDVLGAGSDADVFINIYGENGDTGERCLQNSDNLNKFERGEVRRLIKLRIRHDNTRPYSSWYLDRVEIVDTKDDTTYYFPCNRWLAVDEDDGQIARELVPVDEAFMKKDEDGEGVKIKTGEKKYAGTDANVFAILFGENDDTGKKSRQPSAGNYKNKFEQGAINEFTVEAVHLGELEKLRIGHDNSGGSPGWFLDWVEIDAPSQGLRLRFPCGRWLDRGEDDGAIVRDLYPAELQTELYTPFVPYELKIYTSDVFGAGTDADVFIVLYGQKGVCTLQKHLCVNKRERRLYFERGAEDMFILEDVGDIIEKIRVGHDNRGSNSGWHLDKVEIRRLLRKGKVAPKTTIDKHTLKLNNTLGRWLAKSEDDGETVRELVPSDIITEKLLRAHTYQVSVRTGDMYKAGTDANVFLTIYGDLGDTGERKLSRSDNNRNKFKRGEVDKFTIEAVDLGQVFKIRIRHDNSMIGADWFLDQVEVLDVDTEEVYIFPCKCWLAKDRGDGLTVRLFNVLDASIISISRKVSVIYSTAVVTGDTQYAGTDTNIFLSVFGANGSFCDTNQKSDQIISNLFLHQKCKR
uniref:Lipoxygenase homology PLAT domains 1 n=1 Tax=Hippocampus comes TaxID=109280 RepID=A0A3Q2Z1R5_HIPCM